MMHYSVSSIVFGALQRQYCPYYSFMIAETQHDECALLPHLSFIIASLLLSQGVPNAESQHHHCCITASLLNVESQGRYCCIAAS